MELKPNQCVMASKKKKTRSNVDLQRPGNDVQNEIK